MNPRQVSATHAGHLPISGHVLQRLLAAFAALGSFFLLAKDAGLLIETPTTNLRKHAIPLNLLVEPLQQALETLIPVTGNVRHPLPPSPYSECIPLRRSIRRLSRGLIIAAGHEMSNLCSRSAKAHWSSATRGPIRLQQTGNHSRSVAERGQHTPHLDSPDLSGGTSPPSWFVQRAR